MPTSPRHRSAKPSYKVYQFPYVRFHDNNYPLIPLTLQRGNLRVNTFALLDSGASISVFRPEIAKALKIPNQRKTTMKLGTGNGRLSIVIFNLVLSIQDTTFGTKIGFSKSWAGSFNILGRDNFFTKFNICFNEKLHMVTMVPTMGEDQ